VEGINNHVIWHYVTSVMLKIWNEKQQRNKEKIMYAVTQNEISYAYTRPTSSGPIHLRGKKLEIRSKKKKPTNI